MLEENGERKPDILDEKKAGKDKKGGERETPAQPIVAHPTPGSEMPEADPHTPTLGGKKNCHLRKVKPLTEKTGNLNQEATKTKRMISIVHTMSKILTHSHIASEALSSPREP